jgi:hypothetical protein|tara:strand:+ start:1296 stop:2156 length:861 start_codon:yes stop_codon:yes gene_type:complete
MSVPKFQYKKPLIVELSTGVSGSRNGIPFVSREFLGVYDQNVTISIGQAVETTSNTTFNSVISSNVVKAGNLFLGDGFISSSNSVVAHTGSVVVTGDITTPSMTINGQLNAPDFEVSVTGSTTLFDSGSSRFGDTLDDTHILSGSSNITGSFGLNGVSLNEISNDITLADSSSTALVTENAVKQYFLDTGIVDKNTYNRKSFVHTGSFESSTTSSFTAVTASAPTGLSATTENDFMFFINGMLIENDALTIVQKTSTNLELRLDTSGLGYELESDDEVIGFGKFNS